MLYLVIFILLIITTLVLKYVKVSIVVEYVRNGWSDHVVLSAYVFKGIIKYKYEISLVDIKKNGIKFMKVKKKKVNKEKTEDKGKKKIGLEEFYERIIYIRERYDSYTHIINRLNKYLKGKIALKELDLSIGFGTGDAFYTGILSGILWAMAGIFMAALSENSRFKKKHIDIKTDFNKQKLDVNLYSIFNIKFVHIIVVGFIFLSNYLKRRWLSWQNIRYKVL